MSKIPTFMPKCPNHGCALEGCGFPLPKKGTGICPVSKCPFDFEVDTEEDTTKSGVKKDKDGNLAQVTGWKVRGND